MNIKNLNDMIIYPIGIQTFEHIVKGGYLYVDKTDFVYKLAHTGVYYFLSRPRRFGKSLLISTLESYFLGKRELFKGLKIDALEKDWEVYPVLHLDMNGRSYDNEEGVRRQLNQHLEAWEDIYGDKYKDREPEERFTQIIQLAYKQTGKPVVILIDEYDKPLVETIDNEELNEKFRNQLRAFYGVMKSQDRYIRFAMLTGVTKFSKVSVFSDLNQPKDISMRKDYQAICGITDEEIDTYCRQSVEEMAEANDTDYDDMRAQLRKRYDGYHFCKDGVGVYNPFSLLNAFDAKELKNYWFATGTPTFLTTLMRNSHLSIDALVGGYQTEDELGGKESFAQNPLSIMYQTGYLTIKEYDKRRDRLMLGFPNEEVRTGFVKALVPAYLRKRNESPVNINALLDDIYDGNAEQFMQRLQTLYANLDYSIAGDMELYFHNTLCLIFWMLGLNTRTERHTSNGRMDATVETDDHVYIFEIKLDGSVDAALKQIEEKNYAAPFAMSGKKIVKIAANFSSEKRTLEDYKIVEEKK